MDASEIAELIVEYPNMNAELWNCLKAGVDYGFWNMLTVHGQPSRFISSGGFNSDKGDALIARFQEWELAEPKGFTTQGEDRFGPTPKATEVVRLVNERSS